MLLWSEDAGALVSPGSGELLFYGGLIGEYEKTPFGEYRLKACFDPFLLRYGNCLPLTRRTEDSKLKPENILGLDRYTVQGRLGEDGWTSEPVSMKWEEEDRKEDDYGQLFLKLKKEGRTLLVYIDDWDDTAIAYVLIGEDGLLENWGGLKPEDHTLVDSKRFEEEDPFFEYDGLDGLWEDDDVMLLDDGRILVCYRGHESGELLSYHVFDPC